VTAHRNQPIGKIADPDLNALIDELADAAGVQRRTCCALPFLPFLMLCVHPGGAGSKRVPLHPSRTRPGLLETPIQKIESPVIHELCGELAGILYESLEMRITKKLMTFLNYVARKHEQKAKRLRPALAKFHPLAENMRAREAVQWFAQMRLHVMSTALIAFRAPCGTKDSPPHFY